MPPARENAKEEPPHYRGFLRAQFRGGASTYLDRGSKRSVSVPFLRRYSLIGLAVFVYAARDGVRVALRNEDGTERVLRRVYIDSHFPYLRTKPGNGRYKSLSIRLGLQRFDEPQIVAIKDSETNRTFEICQIGPVQESAKSQDLHEIERQIVELETDEKKRTPKRLLALDRSLWSLPPAQRSNDWRRALVTLYCLFQVNHRTAHKLLKEWVSYERVAGQNEGVEAFQAKLRDISSPNALGRHGYNPSFHHLDLEAVEEQLSQLIAHLQELNVQPFINSGTLLGYCRDGRPIPHDDDFDLGILIEGEDEDSVAANWKAFRNALALRWPTIEKGSFLAVKLASGIQVDLFAAWVNESKLFVHPYCWADVDQSALLPMGSIDVRKSQFPIPADPGRILSVNYGPNWMTPDPFWRFDYKTSKRRFRRMLKKLRG